MPKTILPLLSIGFRPFFLLAGLAGVILLFMWGGFIHHGTFPDNYYSPVDWHAHEMLFGYAVAVLSGFLLTAVKNWTGMETASGNKLAFLALVWLLGRLAPFADNLLANWVIALVDLLFLPLLITYLSIPLWRQRKIKNLPILLLLFFMFLANLLFHLDILGIASNSTTKALYFMVGITMVFIAIIAGRVFPFFIRGGLSGASPVSWPIVDKVSLFSIVSIMFLKPIYPETIAYSLCLLLAIVANTTRMAGWYCKGVIKVPLLWVLLAGYSWMIIGITLELLAIYGMALPQLALHAITVGAIGVITLGMMSRVALGHTGRPLKTSKLVAIAFVVINLAVFFRVIVPLFIPSLYGDCLAIASGLWVLAFLIFAVYYTPIFLRKRADDV